MAVQKRRTRMYEPWGYQEENNYQSDSQIFLGDLEEFFSGAKYDKNDNKIHFYNKDGEERTASTIDVGEFEQTAIIEEAYYDKDTQELVIVFTNGDVVRISVKDLIDVNEFGDGLQVNDGIVSVKLVNGDGTEKYITVDENGISAQLLDVVIEDIKERLAAEIERATGEEERIEGKLDQEIEDRIADVDAEENRAKAEEERIEGKLDDEITRAKQAEQALDGRLNSLNDELDAEKTVREAADAALGRRIDKEIDDRTSADTALNQAIENEAQRAQEAEQELEEAIESITSGSSAELEAVKALLGYTDNDTLVTSNEHEAAFGTYNISNTDVEPSGQTIFSIGNGTSDSDRRNALEVRKDGSVYLLIEGEMLNINQLLGQIAHEIY